APWSGRWRNSSTCSSNARHSAETRSFVIASIPSCSTRRSTLRVETPFTYASSTTAMIACSERRRGSRKLGKYDDPDRFFGINSSISPARVSHARGRYPLRCVNLVSGATSPNPAPSRDLALHQLPGDQRDRLPHEILKPTIHHPGHDI